MSLRMNFSSAMIVVVASVTVAFAQELTPSNSTAVPKMQVAQAAQKESLSITLTGITEMANLGWPPPDCLVDVAINNGTSNHVDAISAHIVVVNETVAEIKWTNLRADQAYTAGISATTTCPALMKAVSTGSNFFVIDRCAMEGANEGECLRSIAIASKIPADRATALDAHCTAVYATLGKHMECSKKCPGRAIWESHPCDDECERRFPLPNDPECEISDWLR